MRLIILCLLEGTSSLELDANWENMALKREFFFMFSLVVTGLIVFLCSGIRK
jgi:hypothetical protein